MFLETIRTEGLGHLSYVIGDNGKAAVIDPRRDCKVYVDIANKYGARIAHIFETHRHEDFVSGSLELARRTQATIHHGRGLPFKYGESVNEGNQFGFGNVILRILETPGHTPESISITLSDKGFSDRPVAVFTGDSLFVGDVGRTDFYPDRKGEMAGNLYDSIHQKLLPLGDHVILYPAHGEGSVCGAHLASRDFSTLGYERQFNPLLQKNRADFIQHKVAENHYYAPYFRQMEKLNQDGIPLVAKMPEPKPANANAFDAAMKGGMMVVDVRSAEAFAGAHIPGSLSIPLDLLATFAGWFLPYDRDVGLVVDRAEDAEKARLLLMRMGYDNVTRYLSGGMNAWDSSGRDFASITAVHVSELKRRVKEKENFLVLDVRSLPEYVNNPSQQSRHVYIGELLQHLKDLPHDKKIITFCASGKRAMIAASLLRQSSHFRDVEVCLGSMAAYMALEQKYLPKAA